MVCYRVFAADLSDPAHVGPPVWDGTLPYQLPFAEDRDDIHDIWDRSHRRIGGYGYWRGWRACPSAEGALRIGGMMTIWGGPTRMFVLADPVAPISNPALPIRQALEIQAVSWTIVHEISWDIADGPPLVRRWAAMARAWRMAETP